jgi:hypothetical protein
MAALQGYLLLYKQRPKDAVAHARRHFEEKARQDGLAKDLAGLMTPPAAHGSVATERGDGQSHGTRRRPVSAFDIDKMFFNPQKGSGFE